MASLHKTIADIEAFKDAGLVGYVQTSNATPFINNVEAVTVPGTSVDVGIIVADTPGEFRAPYVGKAVNSSVVRTETVQLKYNDFSWILDEQLAIGNVSGGVDGACARESESAVKGGLLTMENAAFHGVKNGETTIYKGLADWVDAAHTLDAQGTGDKLTTVWVINWSAVKLYVGQNGRVETGDITRQLVTDGDGKPYFAYAQPISMYSGVSACDLNGIVKIANIAPGMLDDDMIFDAMSLLGAGKTPDALFLSRSSARDLRISRTSYNPAGKPVESVKDVDGVPVYITSALPDIPRTA